MDSRRIIINIVTPLFILTARCLVVLAVHRMWPYIFGKATARLNVGKVVATLGWDFAGVGLGFYVSALLNSNSLLAVFQSSTDSGGRNMITLGSLLVFLLMYLPALSLRFCMVEVWTDLDSIHRFAYGLASIVLGILLMATMSKFATAAVAVDQRARIILPPVLSALHTLRQAGMR